MQSFSHLVKLFQMRQTSARPSRSCDSNTALAESEARSKPALKVYAEITAAQRNRLTGSKHGKKNTEQSIANATQSPAVTMPGVSQSLIMASAHYISLHAYTRPVIASFSNAMIAAMPHQDPTTLATLFCDGSHACVTAKSPVIAIHQCSISFGK
jgi:hypothetical protein